MTRTPRPAQNKPTGPYANPTEIRYHGRRDSRGRAQVYMERPGQPAQVFNPPADYEWGYAGTGPARLAWALLYQHSGGAAELVQKHQYEFKEQVIRRLPREGWTCTEGQIRRWLRKQESNVAKTAKAAAATAAQGQTAATPPPRPTAKSIAEGLAPAAANAAAAVPYRPAA